jgi:protein-S-isoprenylcysteine O-methyltransferase Ste14
MRVLQTIAWAVCVVYATIPAFWLLIHPFAQRWRRWKRSPLRVLGPLWMGLWLLYGAASWPWRYEALYVAPWTWLIALPCLVAGFTIYRRVRKDFSRAHVTGQVEMDAKREQTLVTTGLHGKVRHPLYLAHLLNMIGWSVGSGTVATFTLTVVALLTGGLMIRMEERELAQRFGPAYREYQRHVPAVFPRF